MDTANLPPDDVDDPLEYLPQTPREERDPSLVKARLERRRHYVRRKFLIRSLGVGALTELSIAGLVTGIAVIEMNNDEHSKNPEKKSSYEIKFTGKLTKEDCEKAGYRFTEEGLILPTGELL